MTDWLAASSVKVYKRVCKPKVKFTIPSLRKRKGVKRKQSWSLVCSSSFGSQTTSMIQSMSFHVSVSSCRDERSHATSTTLGVLLVGVHDHIVRAGSIYASLSGRTPMSRIRCILPPERPITENIDIRSVCMASVMLGLRHGNCIHHLLSCFLIGTRCLYHLALNR